MLVAGEEKPITRRRILEKPQADVYSTQQPHSNTGSFFKYHSDVKLMIKKKRYLVGAS